MTPIHRTSIEQSAIGRMNKSGTTFDAIDRSTSEMPRLRVGASSFFNSMRASAIVLKDRTPPKAVLRATPITAPGIGAAYTFRVVYRDPRGSGIRRGTLNTGDLIVTGTNGFSQIATFVSSTINKSKTRAVATYNLVAPDGAWDASENGTYEFRMQRRQVRDIRGNFIRPRAIGSFTVNVPNAIPSATLLTQGFSGAGGYTFSVQYSDDIGIAQSTIDGGDIFVTNTTGFSQAATLTSLASNSDGSQTATYRVTAPGGIWDAPDNGNYAISLQANQVSDRLGAFVPAALLGSFSVNASTIPPGASITPIASSLTGDGAKTFTVTYSDNGLVRRNSIGSSNILVTGPNGFSQTATLVSVNLATDAPNLQATYQITPPGGTWDASETGSYTVSLQGGQVRDNDGNFSPATELETFLVNPQKIRIEAETFNFQQQNLRIEDRSFVSGGRLIRVENSVDGAIGTAATLFTGASGTYDIRIGFFDENDGQAQLSLRLGSLSLPPILLNRDLGSSRADSPRNYLQETIATDVTINANDLITYVGTFNGSEGARFDYIEFIES